MEEPTLFTQLQLCWNTLFSVLGMSVCIAVLLSLNNSIISISTSLIYLKGDLLMVQTLRHTSISHGIRSYGFISSIYAVHGISFMVYHAYIIYNAFKNLSTGILIGFFHGSLYTTICLQMPIAAEIAMVCTQYEML